MFVKNVIEMQVILFLAWPIQQLEVHKTADAGLQQKKEINWIRQHLQREMDSRFSESRPCDVSVQGLELF